MLYLFYYFKYYIDRQEDILYKSSKSVIVLSFVFVYRFHIISWNTNPKTQCDVRKYKLDFCYKNIEKYI